jgi:DNA-binding MarR family transcriptional regulator
VISHANAELAIVLRELAWTIHKRAPERAGVGPLPTTEVALLKLVVENPGSTIGELASALGLHQPNTSAAIRVLVERGLVHRVTDPADRRTTRVDPTELGRVEHEAISAAWALPVAEAIAALDPAHRAALHAAEDALTALTSAVRASR